MNSFKTVHLICQAKGGVGKSFLTYLVYQKVKGDQTSTFIDLDNANQTTFSRLPAEKVKAFNVLDAKKKINREAFLALFEQISAATRTSAFWVDMGATESIEFINMLNQNYMPQDLKEEFKALGLNVEFSVVVAGGDVYTACIRFLNELISTLQASFPITVWVNVGRFNLTNDSDYLESVKAYDNRETIRVRNFGSTDTEESDAHLIELIKNGTDIDPAKLSLATRLKYRKLLNEIEV